MWLKECAAEWVLRAILLRATSATRLCTAGADEQLIMERTGHRSVDGVRSYKRTSDTLRQDVSNILNRAQKQPKTDNSASSAVKQLAVDPHPPCPFPMYPDYYTAYQTPPSFPPHFSLSTTTTSLQSTY